MKQEFVTAEEFEAKTEGPIEDKVLLDDEPYSEVAEMSKELTGLAKSGDGYSRISVPREVKRARVVSAFQDAFELMGGTVRLAHWGDSHPTDFYKLYGRLIPLEAHKRGDEVAEQVVKHILPRGPLDE